MAEPNPFKVDILALRLKHKFVLGVYLFLFGVLLAVANDTRDPMVAGLCLAFAVWIYVVAVYCQHTTRQRCREIVQSRTVLPKGVSAEDLEWLETLRDWNRDDREDKAG